MKAEFEEADPSEEDELLLELLDIPISFHRSFVTVTGRLTAALLLSYLWWPDEDERAGGAREVWMTRPLDRIRDETGLTKDEISAARRVLRELEIVEERRFGVPPRVQFRVNHAHVSELLATKVRARAAARHAETGGGSRVR